MFERTAWFVGLLGCLVAACGGEDSNTEGSGQAVVPETAGTAGAPGAAGVGGTSGAGQPQPNGSGLVPPPDVAGPPADAEVTVTGLATKRLAAGTGNRFPTRTDRVRVDYTGWTTDGVAFDSSIPSGVPREFNVGGVIAGWTEGLQLMVEGEQRRFWIPEALAYRGIEGRPAGMLVFDVELLLILDQ